MDLVIYDSINEKKIEGAEDAINKITVTNHSNAVVYSTFTYTPETGYGDTTGTFAKAAASDGTTFTGATESAPAYITLASAADDATEKVGNVFFMPQGIKEGYLAENYAMWTKLGKIRVAIESTAP